MDNSKLKPAAKIGIGGVVLSVIVIWLAGAATNTDFLGSDAPMFGPFPASGVFIVLMGIVGVIIGAFRKPKA